MTKVEGRRSNVDPDRLSTYDLRPTTFGSSRPGWLRVWWRAVRPHSFTASATPVLVGSAAASYEGHFDTGLFVVTLVASIGIHAATNLLNDYYDHLRGVDSLDSPGPSGVIQRGLLQPRAVLAGALALLALSGLLGLVLVAVRGWPILLIGALGVLAGYAYTGGPLPIGYVGIGDLVVFAFMGPVAVLGSYYVQAGALSATAAWAALPVGALVTAILVVNNLRDLENDKAHGKRTLATFLGRERTRLEYLVLLVGGYVSVLAGIALGALPSTAGLTIFTIPLAARTWMVVRKEEDPIALTRGGLRETARLHLWIGLLLSLGFFIARD